MRVRVSPAGDMASAMAVHEMSTGWEFKQKDEGDWMPVKRVPTNVHLDLMDNGKCVATAN